MTESIIYERLIAFNTSIGKGYQEYMRIFEMTHGRCGSRLSGSKWFKQLVSWQTLIKNVHPWVADLLIGNICYLYTMYPGGRVILACRSAERAEAARDDIVKSTGKDDVIVMLLDLSSLSSIRQFVENFNRSASSVLIVIVGMCVLWCVYYDVCIMELYVVHAESFSFRRHINKRQLSQFFVSVSGNDSKFVVTVWVLSSSESSKTAASVPAGEHVYDAPQTPQSVGSGHPLLIAYSLLNAFDVSNSRLQHHSWL